MPCIITYKYYQIQDFEDQRPQNHFDMMRAHLNHKFNILRLPAVSYYQEIKQTLLYISFISFNMNTNYIC